MLASTAFPIHPVFADPAREGCLRFGTVRLHGAAPADHFALQRDIAVEQERSSTAAETPVLVSKGDKKLSPEERGPTTARVSEATTPVEIAPSSADLEITNSMGKETPEKASEDTQGLPAEADLVYSGTKAVAVDHASSTDKEPSVTTSKKSKKKKRGKNAQNVEPDPLAADDTKTGPKTPKEAERSDAELQPSEGVGKASITVETTSDELYAQEKLASETPQQANDNAESTVSGVKAASQEEKVDVHEREGDALIQSDDANVAHTVDASQSPAPNDVNELLVRPNALIDIEARQGHGSTDTTNDPIEDSHGTLTQLLEVTKTPDTLLDTVGDLQTSPLDQVPCGEPERATDSPEQLQGKKTKKSNKNRQSVENLSDVQETTAALPEAENVREQLAKDALSTEQTTEIPPAVDEKAAEPERELPAEDASPDPISSSKKSRKSKKSKKSNVGSDTHATKETAESPEQEEDVVLDGQDAADSEKPIPSTQAETTTDDSWLEPTMQEEKGKKEGKESSQSADLNVPIEDANQSQVEADPSVADGVTDTTQQESESGPISAAETDLPDRGDILEVKPEVEIVSSKKKSKKGKKNRGSTGPDLGSSDVKTGATDSASLDKGTSAASQSSGITDPSESLALDNPDLDATQANRGAEGLSPSQIPKDKTENPSDLSGPVVEEESGPKAAPDIHEQAKEDDVDVSSTSTSTKKSKKDKKKKRQSVQFVEPIEKPTGSRVETAGGIIIPETTTEPDASDEMTKLPSDVSRDLVEGRDGHALHDSTESYAVDLDPSSVPLPIDEKESEASLPQGLFTRPDHHQTQLKDEHISGGSAPRQMITADQSIDSKAREDSENLVTTQDQGATETQKQMESQAEMTGLDTASDALIKGDDEVLAGDKTLAKNLPLAEDPVQAVVEDESSSVAKLSKKQKKKRKGKSQESQESASDFPALAATLDGEAPTGEAKEAASANSRNETGVEQHEPVTRDEQTSVEQIATEKKTIEEPIAEQPALDDTVPEVVTKKSKKDKKKGKKDDKALGFELAGPSDMPSSSTSADEAKSLEKDKIDAIQFSPKGEAFEVSDMLKPHTDELGFGLEEAPLIPPSIPDRESHQDDQSNEPTISPPNDETTLLTEPVINDPSIEVPSTPLTSELAQSLEAQPPEEQPSESTASRKSKKDKKKKKRDSQLLANQISTTENASTQISSNDQTPTVITERTTSESLPETSEGQAVPTPYVEDNTREIDSLHEVEPVLVESVAPVDIERPIHLPDLTKPPSDQLTLGDDACPEDTGLATTKKTKKDKKKKKKQENLQDSELSPTELEGQSVDSPASIQTSEGAEVSVSVSPEEPKDDGAVSLISAKKMKKDKKKNKAAAVDEGVTSGPPAESAKTGLDEQEQDNISLPTEPQSAQADVPSKSEYTLEAEKRVNVDDTFDSVPNNDGDKGENETMPAGPPGTEIVSETQLEPVQTGYDGREENVAAVPTQPESFLVEGPPKAEDTEDSPPSTKTKQSKKDKRKKKAAKAEQDALLGDTKTLTTPAAREAEQSKTVAAVPAEACSDTGTTARIISLGPDTTQDQSAPQSEVTPRGDSPLNTEDATLEEDIHKGESGLINGNATRSETVPHDDSGSTDISLPQLKNEGATKEELLLQGKPVPDSKKETSSSSWEDELLQDSAEVSAEATVVDLADHAEKEPSTQEPAIDEGPADFASAKKGEKDKKKMSSSPAEELPKEMLTEDPIPIATIDSGDPPQDQALAPTAELAIQDNVDDPSPIKKGKKGKKKKKGVPQDDEALEEQSPKSSTEAAGGDATPTAMDGRPASESFNDDGLAQLTPTKKSKKDKKEKKPTGLLEDEALQEELPEGDTPREDSLQVQPVQEEPLQKEISEVAPPTDEVSAEQPHKQGQAEEESPKEQLPREQPTQEKVSETAQDALASEPGQVSPPEAGAEASAELTIALKSEEPANDEEIKISMPSNQKATSATPTKKSKKDKKKKKQSSSLEVEAMRLEEPTPLEESQPLAIAEITPGVGLPAESEAFEANVPDDMKVEDLAASAPVKKTKKDKKKQALLEAGQTLEHIEATVEAILPVAPDSSEQAEDDAPVRDVFTETNVTEPPSAKKSKKSGKKKKPTAWEDEAPLQLEPSQEPGVSRDASAEPSQSEGLHEFTSGKNKKDKKKKHTSEAEPEPKVQTGDSSESATGPVGTIELADTNSSSLQGEQPVHATGDQESPPREPDTLIQDEVAKSPDYLHASAQGPDPTSTEETVLLTKPGDGIGPTLESESSGPPMQAVSESTTQELSSKDQEAAPQAAEDEPLHELAQETGLDASADSSTPLQEPEAVEAEGATPKVDDGMDTELSKKSKKGKKKKKRASQVSWELEPEAEIEDLLEKQQSGQAFDKPITTEPTEMGNSDKVVEDPCSEFASDKFTDEKTRQNQMDGEPEPTLVEEPKPLPPTEEQRNDMLPDHQSLVEDTQTSLKDSTDLNDTFPETTSSKKSKKKKKKAGKLDLDAEPATTLASESRAVPLLVEQTVIDNSIEPLDTAPAIEAAEIIAKDETNRESISSRATAKNQPAAEFHKPEMDTGQPVEKALVSDDATPTQTGPGASESLTPVEETLDIFANLGVSQEHVAEEQPRSFQAEEAHSLFDQAQNTEGSSQAQSAAHVTDSSDAVKATNPDSSHCSSPDSKDATIPSIKLEKILDSVAPEGGAEVQEDTTNISQALTQESPGLSNEKSKKEKQGAKKAQTLSASEVGSNDASGTNLQSWDWSNIDNEAQPEIPVPKTTFVQEDSTLARPSTTQPSDDSQATGEQEQKENTSNDDDNISGRPALDGLELQAQAGPIPEPEPLPKPIPESEHEPEKSPVTRKKSKKDKKKKKAPSQAESEVASGIETPQTQDSDDCDNARDVAPSDSTIRETRAAEPMDDERTSSRKEEAKKGKKNTKTLSAEVAPQKPSNTPEPSQETPVLEQPAPYDIPQVDHSTQNRSATDQSLPSEEHTSVTHGASAESPANNPAIMEESQFAVSKSRPRTPSPNRQVFTTVDMPPAQLSSHIEHDRPFDQSTQPDKKLRTHLIKDDAMIPESLSTTTTTSLPAPIPEELDSRAADPIAVDIPSVLEESIPQTETGESSNYTPRDAIAPRLESDLESDPMNVDDYQIMSSQKKSLDPVPDQRGDNPLPEESTTGKPDRKKGIEGQVHAGQSINAAAIIGPLVGGVADIAERFSGSKKTEGEKSKHVDKRMPKENDIFDDPALWESSERKPLEEGSKLDGDSGDIWTGPSIEAKERSDKATQETTDPTASEGVPQPTQHKDVSADDANKKDPVMGREIASELSKAPDVEETGAQRRGSSTTEVPDSQNDPDISRQLEDSPRSLHVSARVTPEDSPIPLLPPPRTPSALDYGRSLPPVEEETREDLENELQSGTEDKTQMKSEVNRDAVYT
ncbi:hypothetical protein NUW58_g4262 [Xylaria curta]|uniref:Uncharacterized protein n=1 Tax=Xylaria curta TaxID=42375 RepID=A0ACC1P7A1_9PEZI|nr:hypothetical protein NUW58_g4262 [Xylaria curta]